MFPLSAKISQKTKRYERLKGLEKSLALNTRWATVTEIFPSPSKPEASQPEQN